LWNKSLVGSEGRCRIELDPYSIGMVMLAREGDTTMGCVV